MQVLNTYPWCTHTAEWQKYTLLESIPVTSPLQNYMLGTLQFCFPTFGWNRRDCFKFAETPRPLRQNLGLLILHWPGRVGKVETLCSSCNPPGAGIRSGFQLLPALQTPLRRNLHHWSWSQPRFLASAVSAGLVKSVVFPIDCCLMQLCWGAKTLVNEQRIFSKLWGKWCRAWLFALVVILGPWHAYACKFYIEKLV